MSDEQQDTPAPTTDEQPEARDYTPPASQAELDRIIQNRLERERAKFSDYDSLREKAQYWDEIEQASKTEHERLQEETTRWQSEAETWRTKAVSSRVETLAAADFADPTDALAAISDPAKYLGAGGEIDESAIRTDLAAVLEKKPHWRRASDAPPGPRVPAPNPAQGSGVNGKAGADPATELAAILRSQLGN